MKSEQLMTRRTASPTETEAVGTEFAECLLAKEPKGAFVAMYGDLGAGKTAFVRGAAKAIAPEAYVQSPTYTIVNEYHGAKGLLFHFDMYRIDDEDALDSIAYWDYPERGGYAFVEWSEKIGYALPECYYTVTIEKCPDAEDTRIVTIGKITE